MGRGLDRGEWTEGGAWMESLFVVWICGVHGGVVEGGELGGGRIGARLGREGVDEDGGGWMEGGRMEGLDGGACWERLDGGGVARLDGGAGWSGV